MSKQARAMQKLIRNREGNDAYESDDDNRNPYASSVKPSVFIPEMMCLFLCRKKKKKKKYLYLLDQRFNSSRSRLTYKLDHKRRNLETPPIFNQMSAVHKPLLQV